MSLRRLVVWRNLNKDTYYYKFVSGYYAPYKVGYKNQYNHEVILIIDDEDFQPVVYKVSLLKTVLRPLILLLRKVLKILEVFLQKIE